MVENAAFSYLVGQGAITLILFFLFLLPLANRPIIAAFFVAALFALKVFYDKKKRIIDPVALFGGFKSKLVNRKNILSMLLLAFLIVLMFCKISYLFVETCSKPEYSWDASGNWTGLGKNYFYAEKYRPDKLYSELKNNVTGYPREISIMHYWLFWWMGEANDQWSKIIFPIELLCLLIVFYYGLKPVRGELGAVAFSYLLLSTPMFIYHSTIGYADLTKTVYFAVGIIYFYRWLQIRQNSYFWLFAIPMAFTTWIKAEGKILYAIGLILLLYYLWQDCKESLKSKLFFVGRYLLLFAIIGLPWQLFVTLNGLVDLQRGAIIFSYHRIFDFHKEMYTMMFMEGSWGVFWVMVAAVLLFCFKRQIKGENIYLLITIILFYGNLSFIFLFTLNPIYGISGVFNRVLLPIYPIVVFNLGCVLPILAVNKEFKV